MLVAAVNYPRVVGYEHDATKSPERKKAVGKSDKAPREAYESLPI